MRLLAFSIFAAFAAAFLLPTELAARSCDLEQWPCFQKVAFAPQAATRGRSGHSTSGLPSTVQAALAEVRASCSGFVVVSTHRPGARVAGTGRRSLHSYGLAADFRVNNYNCAYAILARHDVGWSRDGTRCRHIHISDGSSVGREEPAGFRHGRC